VQDDDFYTIVTAPMLGNLTDGAVIHEYGHCETCNRPPELDVEYLEYEFDSWSGEAVVTVMQQLMVSDDLKSSLAASGFTGFDFREMYVEYSESYAADRGDPDLPDFWHLVILNVVEAGDGWWRRDGRCPSCGNVLWKMTDRTTQAIFHGHEKEDLPRRGVLSRPKWDICRLNDPGPAIVSGRMLGFLRSHGAVDLEVQKVDVL